MTLPGMKKLGLAALVLVLVGAAVVVTKSVSATSREDIYLEGAGSVGPRPFRTVNLTECPPGAASTAQCVNAADSSTPVPPAGPTQPATPDGTSTTALYGGSGSQQVCDPETLITFLTANPDKAAAWVSALNRDPTLSWSGGNKLTVADIPAYVRELTPTVLTVDTRVTNHGYVDGRATPRQSLLQAGTAVLVDKDGVPRVRCACGNPLIRPHKVDNPRFVGECWPGCHDGPYCAPPGCSEIFIEEPTTTTTTPSEDTTTTTFDERTPPGELSTTTTFRRPPKDTTTTTVRRPEIPGRQPPPTVATTTPPQPQRTTTTVRPTTTTQRPTTTTTQPSRTTTTWRDPNCPPPSPPDCKP